MARSIDERIVSMAFENAKFEAGVAQTMKSLGKLDATLQTIGTKNSLGDIEKAASKVTLQQPMSALDKLRARLFTSGQGATEGMNEIEKAGNKVTLEQPIAAINKVQAATANVGVQAAEGFNEIERASGRVSFEGLNASLDSVTAKFSVMQAAAAVALGNIATQAVSKGTSFAKSFAFGPAAQGLEEYKTNLSSIQTILANTQGQKVSGLDNVNKALQQLNTYSDQTIYNFSQMAKNIGTFTAAGVDLPRAVSSIKGIANLAALSGSNSQQASTAMYQLSQAIAAGRVSLQDWNSVVNAGMGGAVFQKALMRTAESMGALEKGAVKIDKATGKATVNGTSFRESIMAKPGEQSWLTSDVLTKTLGQFTGDMTDAQLASEGFSKAQIKQIQQQAKTAKNAATEVKTLSQVFDVARESIGSGWATTFQNIFGNFNESKKTFTQLSNFINNAISNMSKARNKVLADWKKLGGRKDLIEGIKNAFTALMSVLKPIKEAFREIFPPKTGKDLAQMTWNFRVLMARLKLAPETAENLKRTFKGFFALLDIGKMIVGGIFHAFKRMFGAIAGGSGGVLEFSGGIGDLIVQLRDWLKAGDRLDEFFGKIGDTLAKPLALIGKVGTALGNLFSNDSDRSAADGLEGLTQTLTPLQRVAEGARKAWTGLLSIFGKIGNVLAPVVDAMGTAFSELGDVIGQVFAGAKLDSVLSGIQTGLIAGIFLALKKALGGGVGIKFSGEIKGLSKSLDVMNGSLKAMQTNIKANTLLQIAIAIGILAASVLILSHIKPEKIASSMTAMAVGLGQLIAAMAILGAADGGKSKKGKAFGVAKLPVIAASLILLSTAIGILSLSVLALSKLSPEEIAKGLGTLIVMLATLEATAPALGAMGPGLAAAGVGIIAIAGAMIILGGALKIFATMSWGEMLKGLVGVFAALRVIRFATGGMGPELLIIGPALILVGIGLTAIAGALKVFTTMKWEDMIKGLVAMFVTLRVIRFATTGMGPQMVIAAAGLILVGIALTGIAGAIKLMGSMDVATLAKGIAAIAATLAVLAVGLTSMIAALPGAAALLVASAALAVFVPVLAALGAMSWSTIAKGLVAIAAAMVVIGTLGLVVTPGLIALGAAVGVFAIGILAAGAGVNLMARGLALLATDGSENIAKIMLALTALVAIVPKIVIDFVKGMVDIAESIVLLAPKIVVAMIKITAALTAGLIKMIPQFATLLGVLIQQVTTVIIQQTPNLISAGFAIILAILTGFEQNIGKVITHGANLVVNFLNGIASAAPRVINAGARLLINFMNGLASKIPSLVSSAAHMIGTLLSSITTRLPRLISAGARLIAVFIQGIANNIGKVINAGGNLIIKIVEGIGNQTSKIPPAAVRIVSKFISAAAQAMLDLANRIARVVINFINGLAEAIRNNGPELRKAGGNLAKAIIDGLVLGFDSKKLLDRVKDAVTSLANKLPGWAKKVLGIDSPSKVFHEIGEFTMLGWAKGLESGGIHTERAIKAAGSNAVRAAQMTMAKLPTDMGVANLDPTITPVLDLSAVHKEAKNMPELDTSVKVTADTSLNQATAISSEKAVNDSVLAEAVAKATKPSVVFEQHNTSPESLSATEIYRRTNNGVSRIKSLMSIGDSPVVSGT